MSNIAVEFLIGGLVVIIGCALYIFASKYKTGNVFLQELETALKPYALQAIFTGEKIARQGLEDSRVALSGADRKAIADYFYTLILDQKISIGGFTINLEDFKKQVTESYFESLVEKAYQEANQQILNAETDLDNLVKSFPSKVDSGSIG